MKHITAICVSALLLLSLFFTSFESRNALAESNENNVSMTMPQPIPTGVLLPIWNKTWGGSDMDWAYSVAVDSSNVYVAGYTYNSSVGYDAFVLKYDLNGNLLWNRTWNNSDFVAAYSIAVDGSSIYVAGWTYNLSSSFDVLLLKYDLNGNLLWNKTWGGSEGDMAYSIAVAGSNVYVAGYTSSYGTGNSDAFVLKCDLNGNELWNKTWGNPSGSDYGRSIAVVGSNIYVAGSTYDSLVGYKAFILKYD